MMLFKASVTELFKHVICTSLQRLVQGLDKQNSLTMLHRLCSLIITRDSFREKGLSTYILKFPVRTIEM